MMASYEGYLHILVFAAVLEVCILDFLLQRGRFYLNNHELINLLYSIAPV